MSLAVLKEIESNSKCRFYFFVGFENVKNLKEKSPHPKKLNIKKRTNFDLAKILPSKFLFYFNFFCGALVTKEHVVFFS
jgi:hypothetical protein